jgi:hypothetical protein
MCMHWRDEVKTEAKHMSSIWGSHEPNLCVAIAIWSVVAVVSGVPAATENGLRPHAAGDTTPMGDGPQTLRRVQGSKSLAT